MLFYLIYFVISYLIVFIGALNIVLYAGIYTRSKRQSILNTWLGSLVGGIPPLMGWAASCSYLHPGAWILAGILYSWQFPHLTHSVGAIGLIIQEVPIMIFHYSPPSKDYQLFSIIA